MTASARDSGELLVTEATAREPVDIVCPLVSDSDGLSTSRTFRVAAMDRCRGAGFWWRADCRAQVVERHFAAGTCIGSVRSASRHRATSAPRREDSMCVQ